MALISYIATLFLTFGEPTPCAMKLMDFVRGPEGQRIAEENDFIRL